EHGGDLLDVDVRRQRERARERARDALAATLQLALTLDREDVLLDLNLEVLLLDARQIGVELDLLIVLDDVDGRREAAHPRLVRAAEETIDILLQTSNLVEWSPTHQHVHFLLGIPSAISFASSRKVAIAHRVSTG